MTDGSLNITELSGELSVVNNTSKTKTLIVIAGPTAIGKTAAAIEIAKHFNTEIISADSRQFYREMTIGTAKPSEEELSTVKHHFVGSISIIENFTAGDFEKQCLSLLNQLFEVHNKVVLVGGSGLFIKAVCEGFDEFPEIPLQIREHLNKQFAENGLAFLQEKLSLADPLYYQQVDQQNPQRLIRALEVFEATGLPYSSFRRSNENKRPFSIKKFGMDMPREKLYERINQRVNTMMDNGLLEEVRSLLPYRNLNALNTVGYSEIFDYLGGTISLERAVELVKQNTRRYAKRQLTWFRKDQEMVWIKADSKTLIADMLSAINQNIILITGFEDKLRNRF